MHTTEFYTLEINTSNAVGFRQKNTKIFILTCMLRMKKWAGTVLQNALWKKFESFHRMQMGGIQSILVENKTY